MGSTYQFDPITVYGTVLVAIQYQIYEHLIIYVYDISWVVLTRTIQHHI